VAFPPWTVSTLCRRNSFSGRAHARRAHDGGPQPFLPAPRGRR
jgi:hypothetical protein